MMPISMLQGDPDPAILATPEFRAVLDDVAGGDGLAGSLTYGEDAGREELRSFLVDRENASGLGIHKGHLLLVPGASSAVDMVARLFAHQGEVVLVEAPTFGGALRSFLDHGLRVEQISTDDEGIDVTMLQTVLDRIERGGERAALLYTIPTFHNPTGRTMSSRRRRALIEVAHRNHLPVLEDDVYRDLYFEDEPPPRLWAADGRRGFSVGSFSKTLAPGLRLGWMIGQERDIQRCIRSGLIEMGGGANPLSSAITSAYCSQGHFEPFLEVLRRVYRQRRDIVLAAMRQHLPSFVDWTHPAGGFFTWLNLSTSVLASDVCERAAKAGVALMPGTEYFTDPLRGQHHLRLSYSHASLDQLECGIRILGDVIRDVS